MFFIDPGGAVMDVTQLLSEWNRGDRSALDRLVPIVYDELHQIASRQLASQAPQTLQSTALVNEAYLKLAGKASVAFNDRAHFFAVAARVIRSILVDHARARLAAKRGAGAITINLDDSTASASPRQVDLLALDEALQRLAGFDPQQARIVELRYFAGLSIDETAEVMAVSPATVKRDWAVARRWIYKELTA
jgi:RNA polymerase sigma factor (TIGR02999 family)